MENASKALLIAGAILIVILLIAVGMLVYSQSRGTIDTGVEQTESMDMQLFLNQFTIYEGKNKSAATTKMALQTLINNNNKYANDQAKVVQIIFCYCEKSETGRVVIDWLGGSSVRYQKVDNTIAIAQQAIEKINNSRGDKKYEIIFHKKRDGALGAEENSRYELFIFQKGAEEHGKKTFGLE